MAQISLQQTVETAVLAPATARSPRLFFVDHWRAALAVLVVLHHVALVYGASVPTFYYLEPPFTEPLAFLAFLVFALFNQAWFMGAFFLLSGYFTPGSYQRKGEEDFLKGRLLRLGVPLLFFYFVLSPISAIGYFLMPPELTGITNPLTWAAYPYLLGLGPLWFVAMLLIFSFGYAGWRRLTGNQTATPESEATPPGLIQAGVFALGLAVASYLMRMVVPLGEEVLGFPTLAYLPQYLSFFVLGTIAVRRDWFRTLPRSLGVAGFGVAFLAAIFLFPLAISGQWFSLAFTEASLANALGGRHWQSAVYALWDSLFAVGLCLGLIVLFRGLFGRESGLGRFLSRQSYAVYVFHIPIVVFLAYALRGVELPALLRFGLAAAIIVPACFAVSFLVRKIPFVSRVL